MNQALNEAWGGQRQWSPQFVETYSIGHDISIMVWGAIWLGGRSDLIIMARDEEAKHNRYLANSCIDVLDRKMLATRYDVHAGQRPYPYSQKSLRLG